jgi:hypothetical protein
MTGFSSLAQTEYSPDDSQKIISSRKEVSKAIREWDRKKLYQLGVFFENIYDKYKDTSINTAISCYRKASSSESEYGNNMECYKAAEKLAQIYEEGKGIHKSLHRAIIYYYLSDTKLTATYNTLGNPTNASFQKMKAEYCTRDSVSLKAGPVAKGDSITVGISPFCNTIGKKAEAALNKISEFLRENPESIVEAVINGDNSVYAAQYRLKVENYVLPELYKRFVKYFVDKEGISYERFSPLTLELDESETGYSITFIIR